MKTNLIKLGRTFIALAALMFVGSHTAFAQTTAFTYEGRLTDNGSPATGTYDLQFTLFDVPADGSAVGGPLLKAPTSVSSGLFTVMLDFGAVPFMGADRWLDIGVRTNGSRDPYTPLVPRQLLTPTPYALHAYNAANLMSFLNAPLDIKVNGLRALRLEDNGDSSDTGSTPDGAPNVIGGSPGNFVAAGVVGATISGGGATNSDGLVLTNAVRANYGTVGGGLANRIATNAFAATIAGGFLNDIGTNSAGSAIGGGVDNNIAANASRATIAGGAIHDIGTNSEYSAIGGGRDNNIAANSPFATIAGGAGNDIGMNSEYSAMGGGRDNNIAANSPFATIAGGAGNDIDANSDSSTIGGGNNNNIAANSLYATIAGGDSNDIGTNSYFSAIGGGDNNSIAANSRRATIAGGHLNDIGTNSESSTIGGGNNNNIAANSFYATIAGGDSNDIGTNSDSSAIGGGNGNNIAANSLYATIAGGRAHDIGTNCHFSAIGGGDNNNIAADAEYATVAGGHLNDIGTNSAASAIGGGRDNNIAANTSAATIAGGDRNDIGTNSEYSAIGGGLSNDIAANTSAATIVGGVGNDIGTNSEYSAIGGGNGNNIAANAAYATIPGGNLNAATNYAFAAGRRAKANHTGAFVWADSSNFDFPSRAVNQFGVRATGGVRIVTGIDGAGTPDAGVILFADDTSWNVISDRAVKKNFRPEDSLDILERLARLPIQRWNYKWEADDAVAHLGPVAQDFKAAFYPGRDDKTISTLEADGVALAAIQGLNQKLAQTVKEKDARIVALEKRVEKLEKLVPALAQAGGAQCSPPRWWPFSRNPIYVAYAVLWPGWMIFSGSFALLVSCVLIWPITTQPNASAQQDRAGLGLGVVLWE